MNRLRQRGLSALVDDIRTVCSFKEVWRTPDGVDCRVSANVGELMNAALMAVGMRPGVQGGAYPCETDYLAASGAVFPDVPQERLEAFNRETLHDGMTEEDEMRRYVMIANFFRRTS